jgi:hypothetical protein
MSGGTVDAQADWDKSSFWSDHGERRPSYSQTPLRRHVQGPHSEFRIGIVPNSAEVAASGQEVAAFGRAIPFTLVLL